jgi:hypothetical protein
MRRDPQRRRVAIAAGLGLVVLVALVAVDPTQLLRALAALAFIGLPTYLITWRMLQPRVGSAGALTIGGGLSIGMVAIAGLLLNVLPWGLQAVTWFAYAAVLYAIGLTLVWQSPFWRPGLGAARHEMVLIGVGGGMLVLALLVARMFAGHPTESFTQLWISAAANAPTSSVAVSFTSAEQSAMAYRLEVLRDGAQVRSWSGLQLTPGQTWSQRVSVGTGRIEARLFRLGDATPYRRVTMQLGDAAGAAGGGG